VGHAVWRRGVRAAWLPGPGRWSAMITGGYATVYITDMDRAVAFYVDVLALKLEQRFGNHWAEVRAGDNLLIGLHPKTDHAPAPGTSGAIPIGLAIDEAIDR